MSLPRVVLVTRGFWPLVGGAETVMASLASRWHERHGEVTIVTARRHSNWPARTERQGVRIVRIGQPQARFLSQWRYQRALTHWLSSHRADFDLVYVSRLMHDADAAVRAGRGRFPVVLRAECGGLSGDCHWQLDARFGRRIKQNCFQAAALVAPSQGIQRELVAAGYPRDHIQCIKNGVPIPPPRTRESRQAARALLAKADPTLSLPESAPLVVFAGRFQEAKCLDYLIRAWPAILHRRPDARLWLIGEGSQRVALSRLAGEMEMVGSLTFAGTFETIEDLLHAADLFVLPSVEEGMSMALLEAAVAGLPVVATDIPGTNEVIRHGTDGVLVPPEDEAALSAAVLDVLDRPDFAAKIGKHARRRVGEEFSLEEMVDRHAQLFTDLVSR